MIFIFMVKDLNEKKLQRAVDLSVEKYCGVMEMFRQFAELRNCRNSLSIKKVPKFINVMSI